MAKQRSHGEGSINKVVKKGVVRYRVRLRHDGRVFETLVRDRKTAKAKLERFKREAGLASGGASLTVGQFLDEWLAQLNLADKTIEGYKVQVRLRLKPYLGNVKLTALDVAKVEKAYARMRQSGVTSSQIHHTHIALSSALSTAKRWRYIDSNPAKDSNHSADWVSADPKPLTPEEARAVLEHAEEEWEAFCVFLLTTAFRWGEVKRLQWPMVDFDRMVLHPPGTKNKKSKQSVPLTRPCADVLKRHRKAQAEDALAVGVRPSYVFASPRDPSKPLSHSGAMKAWKRQCRLAGVPEVRMHDARHSVGSLLASMGVPQRIIMEVMRHATLDMSAWYSQQHDSVVREALDRLADELTSPSSPGVASGGSQLPPDEAPPAPELAG